LSRGHHLGLLAYVQLVIDTLVIVVALWLAAPGVVLFHFVLAAVVVPAALSGVVASFALAVSRAVGETMAVTLAAGATPKLTLNPLESIQTMTAYIVQVALGDLPHGSVGYQTIFAAGLTLMLITLAFNIGGHVLRKRFREAY